MILIKICDFLESYTMSLRAISNPSKLCFHWHHFHMLSMHSSHTSLVRLSNSIMENIFRHTSITWISSLQRLSSQLSHSKRLFERLQQDEYSTMRLKSTIMYSTLNHWALSPIIFPQKSSTIRSMLDGEHSIHSEQSSLVWLLRILALDGHGSSERLMEASI